MNNVVAAGVGSGLKSLIPMASGIAATLIVVLPPVCGGTDNHALIQCFANNGIWILLGLLAGTGVGAAVKGTTKAVEVNKQNVSDNPPPG